MDVTIVGGGTAGLFLAKELKEKGISSIVYEEHKELGKPVHDTGIFSKNLLEFIPDLKKIALNTVKGARLISPNGTVVELAREENEAFILDRDKLEKNLAKGLNVEIGKKVQDLNFKSKYIIGADGAGSTVAKLGGFPPIKEWLLGLEYEIPNNGTHQKELVELYFGNEIAPKFFAWIVPTNKTLRVGLAVPERAKEYLDKFLKKHFGKAEIIQQIGGQIPIGWRDEIVKGNIALLGDAAGQVKPTTGGGVYMGMASAKILANAIKNEDLGQYVEGWNKKIRPELEHGLKIRKFFDKLSDNELDRIFALLQNEKLRNLIVEHGDMDKPSALVKAVLGNPKLIGEFLPYLKYLW
ncbi:TPA: NAD(P)/FAD-dependent oxidoreductase [archaeon]|nr:NAD(P)/FAD-dependent oxidoreductase [Candidatus Naiadarchaeales archaeon SRR2090159.bin1288]